MGYDLSPEIKQHGIMDNTFPTNVLGIYLDCDEYEDPQNDEVPTQPSPDLQNLDRNIVLADYSEFLYSALSNRLLIWPDFTCCYSEHDGHPCYVFGSDSSLRACGPYDCHDYKTFGIISIGAHGIIHRATDMKRNEMVAIKVTKEYHGSDTGDAHMRWQLWKRSFAAREVAMLDVRIIWTIVVHGTSLMRNIRRCVIIPILSNLATSLSHRMANLGSSLIIFPVISRSLFKVRC